MKIGRDTKIQDLMTAFPWLVDEAAKLEPRVKTLKNHPAVRLYLKHATIEDVSRKSGMTVKEILDWLKETFERHRQETEK